MPAGPRSVKPLKARQKVQHCASHGLSTAVERSAGSSLRPALLRWQAVAGMSLPAPFWYVR